MNNKTINNIVSIIYHPVFYGFIILLCLLTKTNAQQLPYYSQYTFNDFILNPAAAGADPYTTISLTNKYQFLGVEGAPRVISASAQTRIMKRVYNFDRKTIQKKQKKLFRSGRVGIGLKVYNFRIGQIDQTAAQLAYAYHIFSHNRSQLSLGFSLGFMQYKINTNNLQLIDKVDDPIASKKISMFLPDVNAGIYYFDKSKFIGLSISQLTQSLVKYEIYDGYNFKIPRQYYLIGGYIFNMPSKKDVIEPSFFIKTNEQLSFQCDLSLKYTYDNKYWVSLGYRTWQTFIFSAGFNVQKFSFGYAFDFDSFALQRNSYGSHEIMLAIKLGDNARRFRYLNTY